MDAVTVPACAPASVVVLASGAGTLFDAVARAAAGASFPASVAAVVTDRACAAERIARGHQIPVRRVPMTEYADRGQWDAALAKTVAEYAPDWVVGAGFMKIFGTTFLDCFGGRIINAHPALLPSFPGAHAVRDALDYGVRQTGSTIHLVDSGVDTGPILAQQAVPVHPDDDLDGLSERIKVVERTLLVDVIEAVVTRGVTTDGRKARLG